MVIRIKLVGSIRVKPISKAIARKKLGFKPFALIKNWYKYRKELLTACCELKKTIIHNKPLSILLV